MRLETQLRQPLEVRSQLEWPESALACLKEWERHVFKPYLAFLAILASGRRTLGPRPWAQTQCLPSCEKITGKHGEKAVGICPRNVPPQELQK